MTELNANETKAKIVYLCARCEALWPGEWEGKFTGTREEFRDWLNSKTGLTVDHITNKSAALIAWCDALALL